MIEMCNFFFLSQHLTLSSHLTELHHFLLYNCDNYRNHHDFTDQKLNEKI